jgi:RNA polymerase I-specific transcription initiation factor RRN3
MMTILPTVSTEKRSLDGISNTNDIQNESIKRVKKVSSSSKNEKNDSFTSKMIIQLTKSAVSSLNDEIITTNTKSSIYDESPINSLANTISLPISNPKSINSENLSLVISHLTSEIARFDSNKALPLIHSILKINWIHHSSNFQNFSIHYATFLTVLVSTLPSWWKEVASKIINDFTKADPIFLKSHHETLKKLISLAPTSSNSLPKLLKLNFPNKNSPKFEIINYVKNILNLSEYYPVLINHIWTLIFENFIKLDVEFQNQIDEIDDDDLSDVLGLDESDDDDDDDDNNNNNESESESENDDEMISESENDNDDNNVNDDMNMKVLDNDLNDESDDENDKETIKSSSKIIKKVKFSKIIDTDSNKESNISNKLQDNKDNNNDDDEEDDEFDDEMLDSEADYTIELESLSDLSSKIDNLLSSILEYLKPNLSVESLESGQGIPIFNSLTNAFRSIILPTHGTKATQYIIFYAAQQQPELIDAFLVSLFEIVFSGGNKKNDSFSNNLSSSMANNSTNISNINVKITGTQYIASFVARAKNLSDTQIASVVTFLVDYCTAYMEEHEYDDDDNNNNNNFDNDEAKHNRENRSHLSPQSNNNNPNIKREFNPTKHSLFYSLVQALMYIVCFRKNSLRESDYPNKESEIHNKNTNNSTKTGWVASLDRFFTRVIISKYDPLRWCNETVVLIFSRVAQSEGICYTWSVIERIRRERVGRITIDKKEKKSHNNNNLSSAPSSSAASISTIMSDLSVGTTQSSMRATQEFLDLIAFFPFDPLLLKKSREIVQETYVEWDNGDDDDDDDDDDDNDDESD